MSELEALLLGLIQGLTEFLPVSSSGHLELGKALLGVEAKDSILFSVLVHGATALATIVVYWKTIVSLLGQALKFKRNEGSEFALHILISMIPVVIVGLFLKGYVEAFFDGRVAFVGAMLLVTGCLLLFTHFAGKPTGAVTNLKALVIGVAQAIAVLPGISRSGATISTALLLNVDRDKAARFSFLMVLPPILGLTLLELKDYLEAPAIEGGIGTTPLLIGTLAAFVSGLFACSVMIRLVRRGKLLYFAFYCLAIGLTALIYTLAS